MPSFWQIEPEWKDETAFVIASGPSLLTHNLELLRGQHTICVNSSFELLPFTADFVIFADTRWHEFYKRGKLSTFGGRIVCCSRSVRASNVLCVKRETPKGLASQNDTVSLQFTTATAAINLAVHLGAKRIVAVGLDGRNGANGKTHAHAEHPWKQVKDCFAKHRRDLQTLVKPLKDRGIEMLLAGDSAYSDLWPTVIFESLFEPPMEMPELAIAAA